MRLQPRRLLRSGGWLSLIVVILAAAWNPVVAQEAPSGLTIHVVQRGENLFRIALNYGISVEELAQLNGIADPGSIQVGQRLLVPASDTSSQSAAPQPPAEVPRIDEQVFHVVLAGETLFQIATQYGVSVSTLVSANSISDPSLIFPGQTLNIPGVMPPQLLAELPDIVSSLSVQPQVFVTGRTGRLSLTTKTPATVTGVFGGMTISAGADASALSHTLLVGIPIDTPSGMNPLSLTIIAGSGAPITLTVNIQVVAGQFITEALTIPDDRLTLLGTAVDDAEAETVRAFMSGRTPERFFDGLMGLPAAAAITSPFGSTRSYNGGVLQRLHLGTDFGGAPGSSIFAPAAGNVVYSGLLEVRGLATIIDHGWGVYTGYWHQTQSFVNVGDRVVPGQVIGTIGMSGRATGPHLHWELWVDGVPVDPLQWVQQSFSP